MAANNLEQNIRLLEVEERIPRTPDNLTLVALGKSGAGKSTLINTLTNRKDIIKLTPDPDNREVELKEGESKLAVIDTPGLEPDKRKEWKEILKKVSKYGEGKAHLILLCIPVGPANKFTDGTTKIMKYIQKEMGKEVWKYCIIVFTFSNVVKLIEPDDNKYVTYLQNYTGLFKDELTKELKVKDVGVMNFFTYNQDKPEDIKNTIVTIPAGKGDEDKIIPGSTQTWSDDLADLIDKKCKEQTKFDMKQYRQDLKMKRSAIAAATGALTGAAAGAGAGAGVGILGGPIGMAIGGAVGGVVGAVAGGVVGGVTGDNIGTVISDAREKSKKK